jgi:hypothetical protein
VFSQLLGAFSNSHTTTEHLLYGRSPLLGSSQIVGTNDVPYPDRVIACVGRGQFYEPRLVSSLLARPGETAILEDSSGTAVHGYRLKQRRSSSVTDALDSEALPNYEKSCQLIASTIENIFAGCAALGYTNMTRGYLRVVDDWDSKNLYVLPNTLPVLIMPYWDNSPYARHAIPTWGGDACIFRLEDAYTGTASAAAVATLRGINQSVRHERTIEWLDRPGGDWKNGWYEDKQGVRWYSDMTSSARGAPYFMMHRVFDTRKGEERDCSDPNDCEVAANFERWGDKLSSGNRAHRFNSVYIANATEFGLFIYESYELRIVRSVFDWETLLSNVYSVMILYRWALAQVLMLVSAVRGKSRWFGGGISCVSGSQSFAFLLLASLPRLKMTLTAFWTVGCKFEGQQGALAEAWFAVYPAIAHLMLIYYSVLNLLAKALRRRVSDVLFTPSVVVLCLMHYFRMEIAQSGVLRGVDGRVPTLIFSDEAEKLQLVDFFTTDTAWRMNGRVGLVFGIKLGILAVNLLPLALSRPFSKHPRGSDLGLHGVEKALALRVGEVGGLGGSQPYVLALVDTRSRRLSSASLLAAIAPRASETSAKDDKSSTETSTEPAVVTPVTPFLSLESPTKRGLKQREVALVDSYELIRLGYVVFGDAYVTTFEEWTLLSAMAPFRVLTHLWNHRVLVWKLRPRSTSSDAEIAGGRALESAEPQMWRLDDPRLQNIPWWQVSACSIQC